MSTKQEFADRWARENATTRRVIHSLPSSKADFQPYPNATPARRLAFTFSLGQGGIAAALTDQWQWPPQMPEVPATFEGVLAAFDSTTDAVRKALASTPDARLDQRVAFFTGPKQMGEITVRELIWFMLLDSIHHRGQFSVYLRAAGEKVPSIYGPSGDEPWV